MSWGIEVSETRAVGRPCKLCSELGFSLEGCEELNEGFLARRDMV